MILDDKHLVVDHSLLKILLYNWALLEFYLNWKYEKPVHMACTSTNVFVKMKHIFQESYSLEHTW